MTNRGAIAAAFVAGAMLVAVAVVAYGGPAPKAELSLAQKKAALKAALSRQTMQELDKINFGANDFGNTGAETGNEGAQWNYGANYAGANSRAISRGWTSGADTAHDGGKGMYGVWGVDAAHEAPMETVFEGGWHSYCSNAAPCTECHGDCDNDSDCAGHLVCVHNNIPAGCMVSPGATLTNNYDYCGDPGRSI